MSGQENVQITFIDEMGNYEAGIDQGGLYKDFVGEFSHKLFDPNLGYFIELDNRELFINPSVYQWVEFNPDIIYRIMGLLIARCFQEGFTLNKILSRTFIRKIKGLPNYFKELKYFDKALYKQLKNLKEIDNIEDLYLTFTINEKDTNRQIELVPNGTNILVTKQNLTRYLYFYADYKMNLQVKKQFECFQKGFEKVFDRSLLDFFSEKEVQLLINGTEESIDVEDLKQNTLCKLSNNSQVQGGNKYYEEFWQVVEEFDQIQRRKLLKFVTNYERPPLFGFKNLHPQFQIDFNNGMNRDHLPTSSTCSNILHLPIYTTKTILKDKLLKAIEMTKGHYTVIIMSYELETFKDFWFEMFCYQYPKTAFFMFIFWLTYLWIKVDCLVDFGWTFNHWIIGLSLVLQYLSHQNARTYISLGILTLWFLRLGGYLFFTRILTGYEDKRYKAISSKSKNQALYFFIQYEFQALIAVFTATPLYFIFRREDVLWRWTFFVGGALALIGIIGEAVADRQLSQYKKRIKQKKKIEQQNQNQEGDDQGSTLIKENKKDKYDNIFHEGLWRKSRHPNLFFELVTWFGFALMGLNDYTISFMAFLGPIFLWAVMYFLTIPISEKSMSKSRKNWDEFCKDTNMFIPL